MGKNYLVTGASSGIGKACAHILAAEDNILILVARNEAALFEMKEQLPGTVIPVVYDLNNLENIKNIFQVCKEDEIKLDGMVYSAGVNADCPIKVNQISLMKEAMTVNCFAFLEMGKYFYSKRFSNDNSSIVAISSIASELCDIGMAPYTASKAALNSAVKTMSKEFIRRKIRVNAILPAGVMTPMAAKKCEVLQTGRQEQVENPQPLGGIPSQVIAKNVQFLMSDASAYTTGELLTIGAGRNY